MEDAHTTLVQLNDNEHKDVSLFAVYDGHGGDTVSNRAAEELQPILLQQAAFQGGSRDPEQLGAALKQALFDLDDKMREDERLDSGEDRSGATAVLAMVTETHIIIANCGDSRALIVSGGEVVFASEDHKPTNPEETERVRAAGGYIEIGRVNGNLAVSRALGDYIYKEKSRRAEERKICCVADITVRERVADADQFIVLACDGIWDVMSNEEVGEFVTNHLKDGRFSGEDICSRLLTNCLNKNSKDNMSATVILLPGAPGKEEGFVCPPLAQPDESAQQAQDMAARLSQQVGLMQEGDGGGAFDGLSFSAADGPLAETEEEEAEETETTAAAPNSE